MKNKTISKLVLYALILALPRPAEAFSFKFIGDAVISLGKMGGTAVSSFWKKIQNNPLATAGIVGTGALLVAAVIAAKKYHVSQKSKKSAQDALNPETLNSNTSTNTIRYNTNAMTFNNLYPIIPSCSAVTETPLTKIELENLHMFAWDCYEKRKTLSYETFKKFATENPYLISHPHIISWWGEFTLLMLKAKLMLNTKNKEDDSLCEQLFIEQLFMNFRQLASLIAKSERQRKKISDTLKEKVLNKKWPIGSYLRRSQSCESLLSH